MIWAADRHAEGVFVHFAECRGYFVALLAFGVCLGQCGFARRLHSCYASQKVLFPLTDLQLSDLPILKMHSIAVSGLIQDWMDWALCLPFGKIGLVAAERTIWGMRLPAYVVLDPQTVTGGGICLSFLANSGLVL
jgi:hypothetical protein